MKLTPEPIEAKRYLQIIEDGLSGYIIRKETSYSGKPNVIHLEFGDASTDEDGIVDFPYIERLIQVLIDWRSKWII